MTPRIAIADNETTIRIDKFDVGIVCLSESQTTALDSLLNQNVPRKGNAITIKGYSDGNEMVPRPSPWKGQKKCITFQVPETLVDHQRLATMRALAVYEYAHGKNIPGFEGPPILILSGEEPYVNRDNSFVGVLMGRNLGKTPIDRRVEITMSTEQLVTPSQSKQAPVFIGLQPEKPIPCSVCTIKQGNSTPILKYAGITSLILGSALTLLGGGFFIAYASQSNTASGSLDAGRALALEIDSQSYARTGGWSLAIGAGLLASGIVALTVKPQDQSTDISNSNRLMNPFRFSF